MFSFKKKYILGIQLTDTGILCVLLSKKRKSFELSSYRKIALPQGIIQNGEIIHKKQLIQIIRDTLDTMNPEVFKDSVDTVVSIPEKMCYTHIFKFPKSVTLAEIDESIPYQAEQFIPFAKRDIEWDFFPIPNDDANAKNREVIYSAGLKDSIDAYYNLLNKCNLKPILITLESEGLVTALNHIIDLSKAVIVLDINYLNSNIYIIEKGYIRTTLSTIGANEMIKDLAQHLNISQQEVLSKHYARALPEAIAEMLEPWYAKISAKIKQAILYYQSTYGTFDVDNVYINGQFYDIFGLENYLDKHLEQEINKSCPCNIFKEKANEKTCSNETCLLRKNGSQVNISKCSYFTTAIGLAIRGISKDYFFNGINLLPFQIKETFKSNRILSYAKYIAGISIIFFSLLIIIFAITWNRFNYDYTIIESKNVNLRQVVEGKRYNEITQSIQNFNVEVSTLNKIESDCFPLVPVLKKIGSLLPENTFITSISFYHKERQLELTGVAKTREDVIQIQQNFEQTPFIQEVISPIANLDKKKNPSFVITLLFTKENFNCWQTTIDEYFPILQGNLPETNDVSEEIKEEIINGKHHSDEESEEASTDEKIPEEENTHEAAETHSTPPESPPQEHQGEKTEDNTEDILEAPEEIEFIEPINEDITEEIPLESDVEASLADEISDSDDEPDIIEDSNFFNIRE